ncbi:MAG: Bax inhibitor-1 family protein [Candidatus Bathyarchaeia archaeon]
MFAGLTAYDTQNIKNTFYDFEGDIIKKEILGALNLYLDFVNIFLDLIKLLGKRRDD